MSPRILTLLILTLSAQGQTGSKDPALDPPVVSMAPSSQYLEQRRPFQGIPGLERTRQGRLWAVWYTGGDDEGPYNYIMLVTSGNDGKTWSQAKVVIDPELFVRAYDPCLWMDPKGRLWLFWAQAAVRWDGRGGVWAIRADKPDGENPKWSAPRRIADGVMMNKPTVTQKGEWLLPVGGWRNIKPTLTQKGLDTAPYSPESLRHVVPHKDSGVVVSRDNGRTFEFLGEAVAPNTQFDEHMVVERKNGDLWMLVRTTYGIGQSVSKDGGRTWSPGEKYMDHVVTRFFVRRLASGKLLMVRHNPPAGKGRSHLTAYLSDDDGASWTGGLLLDEREQVSYPDGVQGADGTVYLIYDRERKGAREILMATFTEEDVRKGEGARLRVVVNRAGE